MYKLTYFNLTGLGEPIRFLLKYGRLDFEDVRIEKDDWPKLKDSTPFGQLPILEVDGKPYNQCTAICRYLAKKVKLNGSNELEDLEIEGIVDTIIDVRTFLAMYFYTANEEAKAAAKKDLVESRVPYAIERLNKVVKNGHLALGRLTWADLYFVAILDIMNFMSGSKLIEGYPNLQEVKKNVDKIPQIKEWLETRPKTYEL